MDLATPATVSGRELDAAERALGFGQLDECRAWLAKCSGPASMRQLQLQIALTLLTCTSDQDLWKVFELTPERASAEDVRRRFRALAKLVHPDKTKTGATARAFESLCQAAETLQAQVLAWSGQGALPPNLPGFNWWEEWDDDAPAVSSSRASKFAHPDARPEDLHGASEEWLKAEAGRRQRELLIPTRDATGQLIPLAQLKQRLESVKQELRRRSASETRWNDGFLPT